MNRKGFTLVELLATLVVIGLVMTVVLISVTGGFSGTKEKTEDVFVETIKDAMEMYLDSSDARELTFVGTSCVINKVHGTADVYKATTNLLSVINSEYKPITEEDLVNPATKDNKCNAAKNIAVTIYRDSDYVYYYNIKKTEFGCLLNYENPVISNLPEGFVCE